MQTIVFKMNMDSLGKLAAPATAKIRQLQKIVQDIRKNEGTLLDKLRRLKGKPLPKVPARDYRDDDRDSDELSEPDYDNETYEDPHGDQDSSYEPPPSHRALPTVPCASLPRGEYLDSCRSRPSRPPRKPLHPGRASKQLPPEPTHTDDEDYIDPDGANDDDNYIEPAEDPPTNRLRMGSRAGRDLPMLPTAPPDRPPSPDFYEVPEKEETSVSPPVNRLCPVTTSHPLVPKASPRMNVRRTPTPVQELTGDDEYEVCDPDESPRNKPADCPPPPLPKPLPRERSPKPPLRPKPDSKPREFESQTLPVMHSDFKVSPKAFTLDLKRPKIPLPQFSPSFKPTDRQNAAADNRPRDEDKDAEVYNKPWYASSCDRRTADEVLFRSNKDGAFMVRRSSGQDAQQPYTLVVFYNSRVYNIPIRFIANTQQYALGREKRGEEYFNSVSHIIENHQRTPLVLIDGHSNSKDATKLCFPMRP
ncbi:B-cell linker protein isoform X2 [Echeneis naucrates]|uniref:SH2 domain-containing protein n=1 Tax=Echeneis naucrates TaxID=173247 RepID=A0A665UBF3_ECHNA|nr:B-cell linker protein isoform X2 [Echeneis naucrates]